MRGVLLVNIVIIVFELTSAALKCDMTTNIELDEGNMGQSSDFKWLGVVQVFLNDGDAMQMAVTGIVLVKANRALASADDIVRIPKRIFQHDTRAMFISDGDVAVSYSLVSYITHPEYKTETFNSIAIILLNIDDYNSLVPVCFPIISFDTSYLYLTGFTDDYEILGKMIYRIQYMDRPECEEFYKKEGLVVENRQPISYLCGKGHSSRKRCLWNNGMALVSNSSGWFTLIGFSIHGPGCAAPARFISILYYSAWIQEVTRDRDDQEDDYDYITPHLRRNDGVDSEFIPIHKTFTALRGKDQPEKTDRISSVVSHEYIPWPFPVDTLEYFKITPSATNNDTVWITPFDEMYENPEESCSDKYKELQYAEEFELNATRGLSGTVTYEFSLYDLKRINCSCVTLEVDCTNRTQAYLEFREVFEYVSEYEPQTPEEVLHFIVVTERSPEKSATKKRKKEKKKKKPKGFRSPTASKGNKKENNPYLRPTFIKSPPTYTGNQSNYHLSIRFTFTTKALLKFKMFTSDHSPVEINMPPVKKNSSRSLRKKMRYWSSSRPVDKRARAAALVVDHEVVLDTVSEARRSDVTPGVVIIGCLLISACSTRILFL